MILPTVSSHRRSLPKGGFSLIEVTVAIGLVAFAVVALLGLMGILQSRSGESADRTALLGALSVMESYIRTHPSPDKLLNEQPGFLLSRAGEILRIDRPAQASITQAPEDTYYLATLHEVTPGYPAPSPAPSPQATPPRHRLIRVKISYPFPAGKEHRQSLVSVHTR